MTKPERQRYHINRSAIVKFGDHIKSVCERHGARYLTLAELYGAIGLPEQKAKRIVAELGNIGKQKAISPPPNSGAVSVLPNYNP